MKKNNYIKKVFHLLLLCSLLLATTSCIEQFNPEIKGIAGALVVDGSLIKGETQQFVTISRSTSIDKPEFIPETSCLVQIHGDQGTVFDFLEIEPGKYSAEIEDMQLSFNEKYKLKITTNSGEQYESDFETINQSSPIDSIYHLEENFQSSSETHNLGLQFYVDLKAPEGSSKYYRWKAVETYMYRSQFRLSSYHVPGDTKLIRKFPPPSDSLQICWSTAPLSGVYTSTTKNLVVNEKKKIPLHYVPSSSYKLSKGYSLLVRQYALGLEAYAYWNNVKLELQESGGIYQNQPSQSIGNIKNINNSDEVVLGFFWASSYTEKRIDIDGPYFYYVPRLKCSLDTIYPNDNNLSLIEALIAFAGVDTLYLFNVTSKGIYGWATAPKACVDCRVLGGSLEKPEFWKW